MDRAQGCTSNLGPIKLKRSKLTNLSTMPGQSDRGLAETQDDGCIVVCGQPAFPNRRAEDLTANHWISPKMSLSPAMQIMEVYSPSCQTMGTGILLPTSLQNSDGCQ